MIYLTNKQKPLKIILCRFNIIFQIIQINVIEIVAITAQYWLPVIVFQVYFTISKGPLQNSHMTSWWHDYCLHTSIMGNAKCNYM